MTSEWWTQLANLWWQWIMACVPAAVLFYLLAEMVLHWGKKIPPQFRYAILLLLLFKCVLPAPWSLSLPFFQQPATLEMPNPIPFELLESMTAVEDRSPVKPANSNQSSKEQGWQIPSPIEILFAISLMGTLIVAVVIGWRALCAVWMRSHSWQDRDLNELCAKICVGLEMNVPKTYIVQNRIGPFAGGFWFHYLVVPESFLEKPVTYQRMVLAHELTHIKRRDPLVNGLQLAMSALCWWNPIVARVNFLLRCEREHCCDDLVLQSMKVEPVAYSNLLLDTAEEQVKYRQVGWGTAFAYPKHAIQQRIRRIVMKQNKGFRYWITGLSIALLFAFALIFNFQSAEAQQSEKQQELVKIMKSLQNLQLTVMNAHAQDKRIRTEDLMRINRMLNEMNGMLGGTYFSLADLSAKLDTPPGQAQTLDDYQDELLRLFLMKDNGTEAVERKESEIYELFKSMLPPEEKEKYQKGDIIKAVVKSKAKGQVPSEMRVLQNALECFFIDNNRYPLPLEGNHISQTGVRIGNSRTGRVIRLTTPINYIPKYPQDPFQIKTPDSDATYRYYSDDVSFYILVSNGPDGDIDFEIPNGKIIQNKDADELKAYQYDFDKGFDSDGDIIVFGP